MNTDNPRVLFFRSLIGKIMTISHSPVANWLAGELLKAKEGYIKVRFTVRQEMTNPQGVIHGGMVSTMLDDLMGAAVYTLNREEGYTSINLNVDFLYAAHAGDVITGEGIVVRAGKKVIHTEGRLFATDGRLMSKASSNLVVVSRPAIKPGV